MAKLHLKTREEFAQLSLHEKNEYLQGIAQQVAHLRGDEFTPCRRTASAASGASTAGAPSRISSSRISARRNRSGNP